jgi:hypothetical protein
MPDPDRRGPVGGSVGGSVGGPAAVGAWRRLRRPLTLAFLTLALAAGVLALVSQRAQVAAAVQLIGPAPVVGACLLALAGVVCTAECWAAWLRGLGHTLPRRTAHAVFYATQVGKYLPGTVWPLVAQASASARYGLPAAAMPLASALFLFTHVTTGLVVGGLLLGSADTPVPGWALGAGAVLGVVCLLPPVTRLALTRLGRAGPGGVATPGWGTTAVAGTWMAASWACYGVSTALLLAPVSAAGDTLRLATGGYALAWVIGFLVVVAPAGAGAREGVLVLVLSAAAGAGTVLSVALLSRVAVTVADLLLALVSLPLLRGRGAAGAPPSAGRLSREP